MSLILQYSSLVYLIDEFIGENAKLNTLNPLDRDSAINWGVDALLKIGTKTLSENNEPIKGTVVDNKFMLPKEIQVINGIYISDNTYSGVGYKKLHSIQYVGNIRTNLLCDDCKDMKIYSPYTFSINYPYLIFNFTDMDICIDYKGFKVDENNIPMFPDIPSVREAIKAYILHKWLYEAYLLDDIKDNKYLLIREDSNDKIKIARGDLLTPSLPEARNSIYNTRERYSSYRIPRR